MKSNPFVNWRARMLYPRGEKGMGPGHYDLQLMGNHTFDGVTYADPVFSYGCEGSTGFLAVFDGSMSLAYYKAYLPFEGYRYRAGGSSTYAQYRAFLALIRDAIDASSRREVAVTDAWGERIGRACRYALTSAYASYDIASRNCFYAVGLWTSALGDCRLAEFAREHPYTEYMARPMVENHPSLWEGGARTRPLEGANPPAARAEGEPGDL